MIFVTVLVLQSNLIFKIIHLDVDLGPMELCTLKVVTYTLTIVVGCSLWYQAVTSCMLWYLCCAQGHVAIWAFCI